MMETVHQFSTDGSNKQDVALPRGARILHAGPDEEGHISLWATVDTGVKTKESHQIWIFGTGHPMPSTKELRDAGRGLKHISTFTRGDVFHVFEEVTAGALSGS